MIRITYRYSFELTLNEFEKWIKFSSVSFSSKGPTCYPPTHKTIQVYYCFFVSRSKLPLYLLYTLELVCPFNEVALGS